MFHKPTDLTPDDQPQLSEVDDNKEDAAGQDNTMEVNCNGHTSVPESGSKEEAQRTEQLTAEEQQQEDQQNANQPENNTETKEASSNNKEHQTCNGLTQDADSQAPPTALSPDSVTVEIEEEEKDKQDEEMHSGGDTKKEDKEKGDQNAQSAPFLFIINGDDHKAKLCLLKFHWFTEAFWSLYWVFYDKRAV